MNTNIEPRKCQKGQLGYIVDETMKGNYPKVNPDIQYTNTGRISWYGHVMRRDETGITRRALNMNVAGTILRQV